MSAAPRPPNRKGVVYLALGSVAAIAVAIAIAPLTAPRRYQEPGVTYGKPPDFSKSYYTPPAARPDPSDGFCDQGLAKMAASILMRTGGLLGESVTPEGLVLVVQVGQWRATPLPSQQRLVAVVDCAIAGPGKDLAAVHVRQDRDGPDLLDAEAGELLEWREAGYAKIADPSSNHAGARHRRAS